jgi:hemoglobin
MACPMSQTELKVSPRSQRNSPGQMVGIDEALIEKVVHHFYDRVREDPILGPIFQHHVTDWPVHLERLCAFWSSVLLTTGRYKGTPMQVHVALSQDEGSKFGEIQFEHWLGLFQQSVGDLCDEPAAELFMDRACRIASSLQMAIDVNQGRLFDNINA